MIDIIGDVIKKKKISELYRESKCMNICRNK